MQWVIGLLSLTIQKRTDAPQRMNGGVFYTDQANEVIVDVQLPLPPPSQNQLLDSLRRCNDLVQRDMRYAHLVAGASKMPMNMIWCARNQDELVNDTDLAKLKSLAWNEFIQKRYLPAIAGGGQSLSSTAASMLEIVREMNLQRRRFQIMGLHEQVEASEIQLVLHLCQAQIIRSTTNASGEYRSLANRFRRHDRLYEAFALAVGAFVCSSAPFTLGAATTRYERDLQYEYKKHTTALFVYVLQQHPGALTEAVPFDEDYVLRISRLIVIWPSPSDPGGSGRMLESFPDAPPSPPSGGRPFDKELMLNAIAAAQTQAEKAVRAMGKAEREVREEVRGAREYAEKMIQSEKEHAEKMIQREKAGLLGHIAGLGDRMQANEEARRDEIVRVNGIEHKLRGELQGLLIDWLTAGKPGGTGVDGDNGSLIQEMIRGLQAGNKTEIEALMRTERERIEVSEREVQRKLQEAVELDAEMRRLIRAQNDTAAADNARRVGKDVSDAARLQAVESGLNNAASEFGVIKASNARHEAAIRELYSGIEQLFNIQPLPQQSSPQSAQSAQFDDLTGKLDVWAKAKNATESAHKAEIDALKGEVSDLTRRIAGEQTNAAAARDELNDQLDAHDERMKSMKNSIDHVKSNVTNIEGTTLEQTDELGKMKDSIDHVRSNVTNIDASTLQQADDLGRIEAAFVQMASFLDPLLRVNEEFEVTFDDQLEERIRQLIQDNGIPIAERQAHAEAERNDIMNRDAVMQLIQDQLDNGVLRYRQVHTPNSEIHPSPVGGVRKRDDDEDAPAAGAETPPDAKRTRENTGISRPSTPRNRPPSSPLLPGRTDAATVARLETLEGEVRRLRTRLETMDAGGVINDDRLYDRPAPDEDAAATYTIPPAAPPPPL